MKNTPRLALLAACILPALTAPLGAEDAKPAPVKVLLMTGQNNHNWKATTPVMLDLYEAGGRFDVTVNEKPWDLKAGEFAKYDVVVSNWSMWPGIGADPWSDEVKTDFLEFMKKGGGLLVVHAGSSIHYQWPEFQKIIGATWAKGVTGHGPRHEFEVTITDPQHPITKGIKPFKTFDELWHKMLRTGEPEILATAFSAKDKRGTGEDEPMVMVTRHGEGRCVNLVLGHDAKAMSNPGFKKLFLRSTEWAATGKVENSD